MRMDFTALQPNPRHLPCVMGRIARCWMADGVEKPKAYTPRSSGSRSFMPSNELTICGKSRVDHVST